MSTGVPMGGGVITARDGVGNPIVTYYANGPEVPAGGQVVVWDYWQDTDAFPVMDHAPMFRRAYAAGVARYPNGFELYAPAGVYLFQSTIVMDADNIEIKGDGYGTQFMPGASLTSGPLLHIPNSHSGIALKDLDFNLNNVAGVTAWQFDNVTNPLILHVRTRNTSIPQEFIPLTTRPTYYAADYGAVGDGLTDNTLAIAALLSAASTGGRAVFGPGIFLTGPQTLLSKVWVEGAGIQSTILRLKAGSNADLLSANVANINMSGAGGSGSSTAIVDFGLRDLTLDGNYTAQTAGPCYPLRFYGYAYIFANVEILNGYSGGVQCDYFGPFPNNSGWLFESAWFNINIHHNLGITTAIGLEMGGPHDSRFVDVISSHNNSTSFHSAPNNGGLQAVNCHMWQSGLADPNSCTWLQESSLYASGCEAEGSPTAQLVILSTEVVWKGGAVYAGSAAGLGVQIGQTAGNAPYTGSTRQSAGLTTAFQPFSYALDTLIMNITHASGHIWFANDGGGIVECVILASVNTETIYTGTPSGNSSLILNCHGFSDARQQILQFGGEVAWGMSSTLGDPGNGGTLSTAGLRVVQMTPASNETGLILQAGTRAGQEITVINRSSGFSATFAAVATSHVAEGVGCTILPLTCQTFIWSTVDSKWYRQGFGAGAYQAPADPGNGGTINTAGIAVASVNPGSAETGLILQAGALAMQTVTVVNRSAANSLTFAASATSHVADGAGDVIAALTARTFVWDSASSLWYRQS